MKNFVYLLLAVLMLTSCESLLEEQPKTQTGTDFFYQNEQDAINALTAAYAQMKAGFG
ncbi:MAG: outer membrane biogenesis lipoprotein LolB, partial [Psychroserpens sp.]